jgi:signal transduction histidine kinase
MAPWIVVERDGLADDARAFRTLIAQVRDIREPAPDEGGAVPAPELGVLAFLMPFSAPRGRQVVRRLLAYAGCRALTPVALEVLPFLRELGDALRRALDPRIEMIVDVGPDCPRCHADGGALEEALLNLIANALDAMPEGGLLRLRARACELPDARPGVEISVSDSGAGMSVEAMRRAGQPFFTTKADRPLAGLGLAATNGFARGSGGVLALQASPSGGLTAALRLPQSSTVA